MTEERIIKGRNWEAQRINPMSFIKANVPEEDFELIQTFVRFNPSANFQYKRREQSYHDGTSIFVHEILARTVNPIIKMESYYRPALEAFGDAPVSRIEYEIGWLWLLTVFGSVDVPAGRIAGEKNRTFMRVRSTLVSEGGEDE